MLEAMDKSRFVRTIKVYNEIGFTPSNTIFRTAMQEYKVPFRQYGGIDHWSLKECVNALYRYYLRLMDEHRLIHKNNPGDSRHKIWSDKYKICADYCKQADDRLKVMEDG